MNKETLQVPKLTNFVNKSINKIDIIKTEKFNKFFSLNVTILIIFLIFFVFFLFNCKTGLFKNINIDPAPYAMTK